MAKTSPSQYIRQVRQEISKVTWPTKAESVQSTIMVFIMVSLAAAFFYMVDQVFAWGVQLIFGLGE